MGRSLQAREFFYRTLSRSLSGGIPLIQAVRLCSRTSPGPWQQRLLTGLEAELSFDEALAPLTALPEDERATLGAAHSCGRLEGALDDLARGLEAQRDILRETVAKSLYPLLVLNLIPFVLWVPSLVVDPAGFARGVLWSYAALWSALLLTWFVGRFLWTSPATTRWVLAVPVLGALLRLIHQRRFLRSLYWLYASGVAFREAVEIAARGLRPEALAGLEGLRRSTAEGEPIDVALSHLRELDPMLLGELMTAAHVGGLEAGLQRVLTALEERQITTVRRLGRALSSGLYAIAVFGTAWVAIRFYTGYLGQLGSL